MNLILNAKNGEHLNSINAPQISAGVLTENSLKLTIQMPD
jgi:hypothetical protein